MSKLVFTPVWKLLTSYLEAWADQSLSLSCLFSPRFLQSTLRSCAVTALWSYLSRITEHGCFELSEGCCGEVGKLIRVKCIYRRRVFVCALHPSVLQCWAYSCKLRIHSLLRAEKHFTLIYCFENESVNLSRYFVSENKKQTK